MYVGNMRIFPLVDRLYIRDTSKSRAIFVCTCPNTMRLAGVMGCSSWPPTLQEALPNRDVKSRMVPSSLPLVGHVTQKLWNRMVSRNIWHGAFWCCGAPRYSKNMVLLSLYVYPPSSLKVLVFLLHRYATAHCTQRHNTNDNALQ